MALEHGLALFEGLARQTRGYWIISSVAIGACAVLLGLAAWRSKFGLTMFTAKAFRRGSVESQFWLFTFGAIFAGLFASVTTWAAITTGSSVKQFSALQSGSIERMEIYRTTEWPVPRSQLVPGRLITTVVEQRRIQEAIILLAQSVTVAAAHQPYVPRLTVKIVLKQDNQHAVRELFIICCNDMNTGSRDSLSVIEPATDPVDGSLGFLTSPKFLAWLTDQISGAHPQ